MTRNARVYRYLKTAKSREIARCRVFRHDFDGHVFAEADANGVTRWVARLTCTRCGTLRVDWMVASTCELISRHYQWPESYDRSAPREDVRRELYDVMRKR